ncbi:MAG: cupin-like domain-containing protein [Rubrivivax sp.]|jgi:hypothetical protein|nr:cupin-like domain-containing protein [Rubrivivax sp.]
MPVDDGWREWVAENRLRGCTRESMMAAMTGAGLVADEASAAISEVDASPLMRAAARLAGRLRKAEAVLRHQQTLATLAPGAREIERREAIARDDLLRDHVAASRPLVLTGLARDWPALERWAPQRLAAAYGDVVVEVQSGRDGDPQYELNKLALRREMPLGDLVARVLAGSGNDLYLTANNQALKRPALAPLLADVGPLPDWVDRAQLPGAALLWIGGAGTRTPLHHDTLMLLHTQVVGRKRWRLASPFETPRLYNDRGVFSPVDLAAIDGARFPRALEVTVLDVVLHPGETLFLPLGWWHQVESLDVSVSLSYTNLAFAGAFDYPAPEAVPMP